MSIQTALPGIKAPRPTERDPRIRNRAIEFIMPEIIKWFQGEFVIESEVTNQLLDATSWNRDGYEIAKSLDTVHGWSPDSELVEILEGYWGALAHAEQKFVEEWVIANEIKLDLKVGDEVSISHPSLVKQYPGKWTIHDLRPETAEYAVHAEGQTEGSNYILKAEQVKIAPVV